MNLDRARAQTRRVPFELADACTVQYLDTRPGPHVSRTLYSASSGALYLVVSERRGIALCLCIFGSQFCVDNEHATKTLYFVLRDRTSFSKLGYRRQSLGQNLAYAPHTHPHPVHPEHPEHLHLGAKTTTRLSTNG